MIVKMPVAVVSKALVEARWPLRTVAVAANVVATIGRLVDKGFARKERIGQWSIRLFKAELHS